MVLEVRLCKECNNIGFSMRSGAYTSGALESVDKSWWRAQKLQQQRDAGFAMRPLDCHPVHAPLEASASWHPSGLQAAYMGACLGIGGWAA